MSSSGRHSGAVVSLAERAPGALELVFERGGLAFRSGEEITLHGPPGIGDRTYSLLGGERDEHLAILFRVVPEGALTPWLARRRPGDALSFTGPHGNFLLRDRHRKIVFVATGTGIAPAVSFVRTHPDLDITLIHGVRTRADLFYQDQFVGKRYVPCASREEGTGFFHGRVTEWIEANTEEGGVDADYYLCGSNDMITEVRGLLLARGCDPERVFAEPYYFW